MKTEAIRKILLFHISLPQTGWEKWEIPRLPRSGFAGRMLMPLGFKL